MIVKVFHASGGEGAVDAAILEIDGLRFAPELLAQLGHEPEVHFSFQREGQVLRATRHLCSPASGTKKQSRRSE